LTEGCCIHMRRCSVGPGICVRGVLSPFPSLHLAPSLPIFPPLTSRAPLKQLRGLEERCKIPQRSPGRSSGRKRIWCTLKLSESHWQQSFSEFRSACFTKLDRPRLRGLRGVAIAAEECSDTLIAHPLHTPLHIRGQLILIMFKGSM